jgi:hypothetical protein
VDYGRSLEFGYFLIPDAGDPRGVLETAHLVDRLGYDLLAVQDHPYQPAHLDSLALLDTFVLMGRADPRMLRTFIEDVAPGVRERVASARAVAGVR